MRAEVRLRDHRRQVRGVAVTADASARVADVVGAIVAGGDGRQRLRGVGPDMRGACRHG
jgi:hypothetical protein